MKKTCVKRIAAFLICLLMVISFGFGIVKSTSMEPFIQKGSFIFYTRIFDKDNLKINDIVLFYSEKRLICHRIIEVKEDAVITKGDNLKEEDGEILKGNIIGKLLFKL